MVEIASGAVVSGEPPAEELWMRHALTRFGDDAAKEYVSRLAWEVPDP